MANPPIIICDADAVIRILCGGFPAPLKCLRTKFGVQPVVVDEVEVEIRNHKKHGVAIPTSFKKAVEKGLIAVLDLDYLVLPVDLWARDSRDAGYGARHVARIAGAC